MTACDQDTIKLAYDFAKQLKPGSVIALRGNLGAGKTTFVKGIALGLGLKNADDVKSPTFALMHTYKTKPVLYHFDFYRLESEKEIANIGFEEFVDNSRAIICVEWPERGQKLLPKSVIEVQLEVVGPQGRKIKIHF